MLKEDPYRRAFILIPTLWASSQNCQKISQIMRFLSYHFLQPACGTSGMIRSAKAVIKKEVTLTSIENFMVYKTLTETFNSFYCQ